MKTFQDVYNRLAHEYQLKHSIYFHAREMVQFYHIEKYEQIEKEWQNALSELDNFLWMAVRNNIEPSDPVFLIH